MAKRPAHKRQPAPIKQPAILAKVDPLPMSPAWRISMLEMVDPFGWHVLETEKLDEIRRKLSSFEAMTWHEILVVARHRNHAVPVDRLSKVARDRLEELGQGDIDEIVSLRLSGPERVWGIRTGNILKILWWDPDHGVCPSILKYT